MFRRAAFTAAIGLAAAAAAAVTLGAGPAAAASTTVAQWQMDEPSGTTMVDSSGNGNDGTTYDITRTDEGYSFNGLTSKVVVPSAGTLNPGPSDFSISVQMKSPRIPPSGTDYDLIRKGTSGTTGGEYKLEVIFSNGIGKAFCLMKDGSGVSASVKGTTNVTDDAFHTLTCQKTSTSLILTVDNLAPRTKAVRLSSIANNAPLTLSAKTATIKGTAGDWFTGVMRSASVSVG
jgi:hypothetical protein